MPDLMQRRDLLKIASAALLGMATGRANWAMPRELVQNVAKAADWKPAFFNRQQDETVVALTDLIIPKTDTPGAKEANVHRYIDLFLSVSNPTEQKRFRDGLRWLDSYANRTYKHNFVDCSEADQTALLSQMAGRETDEGHAFFDQAKTMTSAIYYSTPEGYQELKKLGPAPSSLACESAAGKTL